MSAPDRARDRLTTYGTAQYTYNAQGQLATRFVPGVGTTTYTYDLLGALRSASLPDGHVITYRVDAMGRRIERARDGMVTARWVYLDGLHPIAELDGTNAVRSVFVYGEGRVPSLMIRGGVTYRIITDHVGTVRRVINPATGAVVWSRDYDSFGPGHTTNPGWLHLVVLHRTFRGFACLARALPRCLARALPRGRPLRPRGADARGAQPGIIRASSSAAMGRLQ